MASQETLKLPLRHLNNILKLHINLPFKLRYNHLTECLLTLQTRVRGASVSSPNVGANSILYYTSTSNCPIRKLSLWHVNMKLIAISRLTSSISEPAFLLTMFHPMFPGNMGLNIRVANLKKCCH